MSKSRLSPSCGLPAGQPTSRRRAPTLLRDDLVSAQLSTFDVVAVQVTVIMAAYNAQAYVAAALASVREQTFTDHAVVVVDAGSSDTTAEVVAQCRARDERIHLVRSPRRLSAPQARNAALAEVTTELVATLDADDIMLPNRLQQQVALMHEHPESVAVGGWLQDIDADGLPLPASPRRTWLPPQTPSTIAYAMPFMCPFLASAGMYQTDALREIDGFDEDSPWADDYATIWHLSRLGPLRQLPLEVGQYRRHRASVTARKWNSQRLEVVLLRRSIAADVLGRPPALSSVLAWTETIQDPRPAILQQALNDLVEMHTAYLAGVELARQDRAWVDAFHASRVERLATVPWNRPEQACVTRSQ